MCSAQFSLADVWNMEWKAIENPSNDVLNYHVWRRGREDNGETSYQQQRNARGKELPDTYISTYFLL